MKALAHIQVDNIAVDSFGNIWALTQTERFSIYNPNGIDGFDCIDHTLERVLGVGDVAFNEEMDALNYPNPFSGITTVAFTTNDTKPVSVEVFDVLGRSVKSLKIKEVVFGKNTFQLDLSQHDTGIYFCKITSNKLSRTIKLLKN